MTQGLISNEELARPNRHLFLSPHYDDIALSCGGTAALLAELGRQPEIALLFGSEPDPKQPLTEFAEMMHRQWGMEASEVIARRRKEEATASAILGARDSFAPFHDAIYRGDRYTSDEELFGSLAADDAGLPREIIAALDLVGDRASMRVYAPLAIGNHVDHQVAWAAGIELAKSGWEVWFYEDLPYAAKPGSREARFVSAGNQFIEAARVNVTNIWDKKIDAIMAYPSQLSVIFGYIETGSSRAEIATAIGDFARAIGNGIVAERFWKLSS